MRIGQAWMASMPVDNLSFISWPQQAIAIGLVDPPMKEEDYEDTIDFKNTVNNYNLCPIDDEVKAAFRAITPDHTSAFIRELHGCLPTMVSTSH